MRQRTTFSDHLLDQAPVRARLRAGVIARIERASGDWRLISVGELKGWAPVSRLWGAE